MPGVSFSHYAETTSSEWGGGGGGGGGVADCPCIDSYIRLSGKLEWCQKPIWFSFYNLVFEID